MTAAVHYLSTEHLRRCIETLETAFDGLHRYEDNPVMYDVFRAACVKQFELVLEQSGNLLKKRLRPWFVSHRQADSLAFKDVFRHAAKHALIPADACERWLRYRDNRNTAAHDYGERFAETTLKLLPAFIADAKTLADAIEEPADD